MTAPEPRPDFSCSASYQRYFKENSTYNKLTNIFTNKNKMFMQNKWENINVLHCTFDEGYNLFLSQRGKFQKSFDILFSASGIGKILQKPLNNI